MQPIAPDPNSLQIKQTKLLPYQVYYQACDLATKEEIRIASGEWVHCFTVDNTLMVSSELYKVLEALAKEQTGHL